MVRRRRNGFGGGLLAAAVPMLLLGGLAFGFFIGNFIDSGPAVNNTNIININGTSLTNTFTPMNTAMATNTNNDDDDITNDNTNTNMNMNPPGRRRRRSVNEGGGLVEKDPSTLLDGLFRLAGVSKEGFYRAFLLSVGRLPQGEALEQATLLARKISCVRSKIKRWKKHLPEGVAVGKEEMFKKDSSARNHSGTDSMSRSDSSCLYLRATCEHFEDNHLASGGNLILRLAEVYAAHLLLVGEEEEEEILVDASLEALSEVMDAAVRQECAKEYLCSRNAFEKAEECFFLY